MAQPNTNANIKIPANNAAEEVKGSSVFHDFLGKGCAPDSSPAPPPTARPPLDPSSGAGCGPVSTTSDMSSGQEASFRFSGSKRCSSDSNHSIMGSCKDRFPGVQPDSLATSHVMKLLRGAGGERPRGPPYNEEPSLGVHPMRPLSLSSLSMGARTYANTSKWDRVPISATPTLQYSPHATQAVSFGYQAPANRFRENNAGPSVISQAAADEGSRTGIKGSGGILRSINTSAGMSDNRTLSGVPLSGCKQSFGVQSSEPESSNPSRQGVASAGHQMTIFYGGQAHVFDDVHPNKADLIMALAGSNGGSWSTTYAPKSAARVSGEKNAVPAAGEKETGAGSGSAILRELQGRASLRVGSSRPFGSGDQSFLPPGNHQGGSMTKETRTAVQVAEALNEEKSDV
ncbi:protein TIFY 8-like [Ipomoea triloba]|uniref:protein TIFY 8-like n=1 Tax=Ipomoea triloba TaxID=35885 RepID=UPI00125DE797|nr:protein TIFY 8-like [Ipomoea triloba]